MAFEITPELLDAIIADFEGSDDRDDPRRLWQGVRFMEREGIDLSFRSAELLGYLRNARTSPIPAAEALSDEDVRDILLAVRSRARKAEGLPPLTDSERQSWSFHPRPFRGPSPGQMQTKIYGANFGGGLDADVVEARIRAIDPELMAIRRTFMKHNALLPRESPARLSLFWLDRELQGLILEQFPEAGGVDALELIDAITRKEESIPG